MNGTLTEKEKTSLPSQDNGPPTKNGEYWIQGDFVVFKVENSLFRVPSYQFIRHSVVFADMFNLPQREKQEGSGREGSDDKNPIILPETITANDFCNFLKVLYPQSASIITPGLLKEELTSVLKLSTMWYFLEYRAVAIKALSSLLTPAEKIAIGRKYRSHDLVIDGFNLTLTRSEQIKDEDAILMEPMTAVALGRLRETYAGERRFPSMSDMHNMHSSIERTFRTELGLIKQEEMGYTVTHM